MLVRKLEPGPGRGRVCVMQPMCGGKEGLVPDGVRTGALELSGEASSRQRACPTRRTKAGLARLRNSKEAVWLEQTGGRGTHLPEVDVEMERGGQRFIREEHL